MSVVVPLDFSPDVSCGSRDVVIFVAVALVGVIGSSFKFHTTSHDPIHPKKYAHPHVAVRSDS
jgi:hypothetical protein